MPATLCLLCAGRDGGTDWKCAFRTQTTGTDRKRTDTLPYTGAKRHPNRSTNNSHAHRLSDDNRTHLVTDKPSTH